MMTGQCCTGERRWHPRPADLRGHSVRTTRGGAPGTAEMPVVPRWPARRRDRRRRLSSRRGAYARMDRGVLGVNPVL